MILIPAVDTCLKQSTWVERRQAAFTPTKTRSKVLSMHASKGLEFAVVALVGAGRGAVVLCGGGLGCAAIGDYGK